MWVGELVERLGLVRASVWCAWEGWRNRYWGHGGVDGFGVKNSEFSKDDDDGDPFTSQNHSTSPNNTHSLYNPALSPQSILLAQHQCL